MDDNTEDEFESSFQEKQERFTVKRTPKVQVIEESQKDETTTSVCMAIIKWVATIFFLSLALFCLVASKISFVTIALRMNPANLQSMPSTCKAQKYYASESVFVMVLLLLVIPHIISFVRAIINSGFSQKQCWPSKVAVIWGVVGALLEVIGVTLFAFLVISVEQNSGKAIALMNGIFIVPAISLFYGEIKLQRKQYSSAMGNLDSVSYPSSGIIQNKNMRVYRKAFLLLSILCSIGGFIFVGMHSGFSMDMLLIVLSMLALSLTWSSKFFFSQIQVKVGDAVDVYDAREFTANQNPGAILRVKTARHRMTLITSLIKIVLIFFMALTYNYFFHITCTRNPFESLSRGFTSFGSKQPELVTLFCIQIASSFIGYMVCVLACSMNLQKICFAIPQMLATPLSIALVIQPTCMHFMSGFCMDTNNWKIFVAASLFWIAQILCLGLQTFSSQQFLMAREELLFWLPTYDACFLEQHVVLNRKNEVVDEQFVNYHELVRQSHIYICTTMYHETDFEMEQLLQSLSKIDQARKECGRQFEAHIFFDDGARGDVVKLYALQLLSLLKDTMGVDPGKAFKLETPYGLQLKWSLPHGMPFVLHLKDKIKVKAKKRWSQVMYMSYVLDFKQNSVSDDLTYILATDADVKFTPNDVMALMDLMSRNPDVGAVCGRTHPLGSGPMVWYQIFDYAIGHWLLKVANHVYGSVLCSPGCFSVYRAKAIRDVLPLYASSVDCAMDFLMKDMGEDRWFCTLMVEAGWKLEYCATAENSTYCPDNFDEFFKQRRRWGPSTFANSIVVINEQSKIRSNNDVITFFFILYQMVLMVSSIIGPSTVLLVIAGGLQYAFPYSINMVVVLVLLLVVTFIFTVVCLYCDQNTQLKFAKLLTFGFAIIMAITFVGILLQTVDDIHNYMYPPLKPTSTPLPHPRNSTHSTVAPEHQINPYIFNPSTWYLLILTGIFVMTAVMHGLEGLYLIHGIWYLLCLPSGYLLLTIYSVANLTDRSWGTREGKSQTTSGGDSGIRNKLIKYMKYVCWCCIPPHLRHDSQSDGTDTPQVVPEEKLQEKRPSIDDSADEGSSSEGSLPSDSVDGVEGTTSQLIDVPPPHPSVQLPKKSALKKSGLKTYPSAEELNKRSRTFSDSDFRFPGEEKTVKFSARLPHLHAATPVEEWLPSEYQCYVENFKTHGYDNVSFIAGIMKEKDLMNIGIANRGHRKKLITAIDSLPPEEFFQEVPENVEDWLIKLGLDEYWPKFCENSYTEPRDLADIKYMSRETIATIFEIKKEAHLKKLAMATSVLQYPTKAQTRIREARKAIMAEPTKNLKIHNADDGEEWDFWEELRLICLLPEQAAFNQSGELVEKLGDLRDTSLLVLTVSNVLWLTFMVTIMEQTRLEVLGTSFASFAFLLVYTVVLVMQFVSMLCHRLITAIHFIARAPFKPGHFKSNWSWRDADLPPPPDPALLEEIRRKKRKRSNETLLKDENRHSRTFFSEANEPLLRSERHATFT